MSSVRGRLYEFGITKKGGVFSSIYTNPTNSASIRCGHMNENFRKFFKRGRKRDVIRNMRAYKLQKQQETGDPWVNRNSPPPGAFCKEFGGGQLQALVAFFCLHKMLPSFLF